MYGIIVMSYAFDDIEHNLSPLAVKSVICSFAIIVILYNLIF
jgi:hypothetical protein